MTNSTHAGPAAPPKPRVPQTVPSTADRAALGAVWALPLLAVVLKVAVPGWVLLFLVIGSPIVLALLVSGLVTFTSTFRRRSRVRAAHGQVPPLYRALAWAWGGAWVLAAFVVADAGDIGPMRSPLTVVTGLGEPDWYPAFQGLVLSLCITVVIAAPVVTWIARARTPAIARTT
ncbi:hypothetical protein ACTHAM_001323 [Cellulomonas soli]|uniref:hypothetical protein n=1 Tax=Cellulomonas soli TaxID=931535 RepID=UPI001D5C7A63|nr:hypothetical protein [Cellulomonadaceae bacterium]